MELTFLLLIATISISNYVLSGRIRELNKRIEKLEKNEPQ